MICLVDSLVYMPFTQLANHVSNLPRLSVSPRLRAKEAITQPLLQPLSCHITSVTCFLSNGFKNMFTFLRVFGFDPGNVRCNLQIII